MEVAVDLSPQARASHQASDTVFIYAQAASSRMPLAVTKTTVSALPTQVLLDSSMTMTPGQPVVTASEVKVSARISRSGQAIAQPGDWGASQSDVKVQGQPKVSLKITGPLP